MKSSFLLLLFFLLTVHAIHAQTVNVSTASQLQNALNTAVAGQTILLADGIYSKTGGFIIPANIHGSSTQPITLKGSRQVIITSGSLSSGYGLGLRGNTYWILDGFTVYNSAKGIVLDSSHHNTIKNVYVNKIGDEGIHLRSYSSFNSIDNCLIDSTGQISAGFGEAIYIGSANTNWSTYTKGNPDTCNYNIVTNNSFGDHVASENIDIKEGTKGGRIAYNTFNGTGLNNQNSADSWIDVKGNNYMIECNTGSNTIADGFQTHILVAGWGNYNTFSNNSFIINNTGYGILITTSSSKGTAANNVVCSNNSITGTNNGLSNSTTQACSNNCITTSITKSSIDFAQSIYVYPNPAATELHLDISQAIPAQTYDIIDALGKIVQTGNVDSGTNIILINHLSAGTYILTFPNTSYKKISFIKK